MRRLRQLYSYRGDTKMEPKISIIIPVYNVEKYIVACFESVLSQHYRNYEVLLIDDGSSDSSGKICDSYAARDSRFIVRHTENRGIGNARNLGLNLMTGEYCFFLDPDDLLSPTCLPYLRGLIERHNADIVLGVSKNFSAPEPEYPEENDVSETVYRSHKEIMEKILFDKSDMKPMPRKREASVVNYEFFSTLYKVDFLRKHNIRFLDISYGEDTYVCLKYLILSDTAVTTSKITYWHRRNTSSTTFRYHENYLDETKRYYEYYTGLFREHAPDYFEQAVTGLKGQYFRRCVAAVEREIMFAQHRSFAQIREVIIGISKDEIFKSFLNRETIANNSRHTSTLLRLISLHMCSIAALAAKLVGCWTLRKPS